MMTERVRVELERLEALYGNGKYSHTYDGWERLINQESTISFSTFKRYAKLVKETIKTEYTLEEIVNLLNDCAGSDCYGADWDFKVIDNKVYEIDTVYRWRK